MAATVFAAAGGVVLAAGGADARNPLHPQTLGLMHLWLVGWLSLTAVGVLLQFLPVTSGVGLFSARVGWLHFGLHVGGVAGLAGAFMAGPAWRFAAIAGGVLWCGLALAAFNLGTTLLRSRERHVWRTGALLALAHLIVTPSLGWLLLTFLGDPWVGRNHVALLVIHAHLGLGGWLFGLVIAVGGRLLPMFLVAPEPEPWQVATALGLLQSGLAVLVLAAPWPAFGPVAVTLLALAVGWWVGVMGFGFMRRKKRVPDLPMFTAWNGLGLLALVVVAGIAAYLRPGFDGWGTYGVLALAAGGLMTNGLLYRIVPFLVRLDRFRKLPGNPAVPALDTLLQKLPTRTQVTTLAAGFAFLAADSVLPMRTVEIMGRWAVAIGTLALAGNIVLLILGPPQWRALFERRARKPSPT